MPVRLRLTLSFGLLVGAALTGSALLIYSFLSHQLTADMDERLDQVALQVHRNLNIPQQEQLDLLSIAPARLVPSFSEFAAPGLYVQVLDGRGRVVATSPNLRGEQLPVEPSMLIEGLSGRSSQGTLVSLTGDQVRVRTIPMIHADAVIGMIQVGQSLHHVQQTLQWVGLLLAIGVASLWGLATFVEWIMAGRALLPVSAITRAAASIAQTGEFSERIAHSGPQDEIGQLASTFNCMIDRLQTTFQSQQQFIADSSHELGTPIAVIRGNAELLGRSLSPEEAEVAIQAICSESARMERIVTDLLNMAELDLGQEVAREPVRLDLVAQDAFARTRPVADGLEFRLGETAEVVVPGNREWLHELMLNLLDNAIKYTPSGGRVEVSVRKRDGFGEVVISDTGVGIPPHAQKRIFDRFYRVDKARSRASGGTGLGLSIARAIVEAHEGRISVASEVGKGSVFVVQLPADGNVATSPGGRVRAQGRGDGQV